MAEFSQLSRDLSLLARQVESGALNLLKKSAVAIDTALVLATPVDTGRARSNWQVEINTPITDPIEAFSKGKNQSTLGENTRTAIENAKQKISVVRQGNSIHITNNLSYIARLNDGWSDQAPQGFIQRAISAAIQSLAQEVVVSANSTI